MDVYMSKKYNIEQVNKYGELESFIEEANTRNIDIISVVKDINKYIIIYKSNEVEYEIR